MASGLLLGATFPVDSDSSNHRNHEDQYPAKKLRTSDRQPCHSSEA